MEKHGWHFFGHDRFNPSFGTCIHWIDMIDWLIPMKWSHESSMVDMGMMIFPLKGFLLYDTSMLSHYACFEQRFGMFGDDIGLMF